MLELILFGLVPIVIYVWMHGIEHVIIHQRWIFVCLFLMPFSVIFETWMKLRNWLIFKLSSAPKLHQIRVKSIQKEIRQWNEAGRTVKMCTARPGWQTVSLRVGKYKDTHKNIEINLMDILNINEEKHTVLVEPLVSMGQLTHALVPLGWTLPVVPELDMLTVGGLIMGCGVETSSFKYGLFQHICVSYDIITANGSLLHCSKDENTELFYQIPWSYGTLGFLVAAELKIIPSKKFVKMHYERVLTLDRLNKRIHEEVANESNDFVECLAYSIDNYVMMLGRMTDECEQDKINEIGKFWKPWFFKHVEKYLHQNEHSIEYIPLHHYYHRHTRSLFWELQDIIPFGNNPLFRYVFGWAMPPQISLLKITSPQILLDMYETKHVVQDMLVPINDLKSSLQCFEEHLQIYPLWICPFKLFHQPGIVHPHSNSDAMYVDIGAYGSPSVKSFDGPETMKKIERYVLEKKGYQMLYADSYLTEEHFYQMFDHTEYERLRKKYNAQSAFPTIYEKVCRKARL